MFKYTYQLLLFVSWLSDNYTERMTLIGEDEEAANAKQHHILICYKINSCH